MKNHPDHQAAKLVLEAIDLNAKIRLGMACRCSCPMHAAIDALMVAGMESRPILSPKKRLRKRG